MRTTPPSVEYCHIYTDRLFSAEQSRSIELTKQALADLTDYTTVVLIDDYHPSQHTLDIPEFLDRLDRHQVAADFWAFESSLVAYQDALLELIIDRRIRFRYERYIRTKGKLPCSFLTTIWYFLRLGVIADSKQVITACNGKLFQAAVSLVNILPSRFETPERQTIELIRATTEAKAADRINTTLFKPAPTG